MSQIRCLPAGDMALNVDFGSEISEPVNNQVQSLMQALDDACIPGIIEAVPTFRSVLIHYDQLQIGYDTLCEKVTALTKGGVRGGASLKRIFEIPVCYGARFGVDLHYRIYMLGFLPGFPYLGGMDPRIAMPRLSNPRTKIPEGSVGIGGSQTGIYPMQSPGGWRLLGATPIKLYDPDREKPILYEAGDYIRFVPISLDDYYDIHRMAEDGRYTCRVTLEPVKGGVH